MEFNEVSGTVLADIADCVRGVSADEVRVLVDMLAAKQKVFLIGTGRSGAMLRATAVRLGHLGVEAHLVGEPGCPAPQKGDLVLVGSGSGRTPAALERAERAHRSGAQIAVVTAAPTSPIATLADAVVHIPAPFEPEKRTPHTLRSLFEECLLVVCDCVCRMLQERLGITTEEMQSRHSLEE